MRNEPNDFESSNPNMNNEEQNPARLKSFEGLDCGTQIDQPKCREHDN